MSEASEEVGDATLATTSKDAPHGTSLSQFIAGKKYLDGDDEVTTPVRTIVIEDGDNNSKSTPGVPQPDQEALVDSPTKSKEGSEPGKQGASSTKSNDGGSSEAPSAKSKASGAPKVIEVELGDSNPPLSPEYSRPASKDGSVDCDHSQDNTGTPVGDGGPSKSGDGKIAKTHGRRAMSDSSSGGFWSLESTPGRERPKRSRVTGSDSEGKTPAKEVRDLKARPREMEEAMRGMKRGGRGRERSRHRSRSYHRNRSGRRSSKGGSSS